MHFRTIVADKSNVFIMDPLYDHTRYLSTLMQTIAAWKTDDFYRIEYLHMFVQHDSVNCGHWIL